MVRGTELAKEESMSNLADQYETEAMLQRREGRFNLARRYDEIAHMLRQRGRAALEHKTLRGIDARDE